MAEPRTDGAPKDLHHRVFAYVVAERAELYVEVIGALAAAKERFRLQLRPGDVVQELAGAGRHLGEDEVRSALETLAEWAGRAPEPAGGADIWQGIWCEEAHHSTAIEDNTLVLKQVSPKAGPSATRCSRSISTRTRATPGNSAR